MIVTTNQSVIARGMASETTVRDIHARMVAQIVQASGRIDAVYYCPHKPEDRCDCRKPAPGMYQRAAREWNLELAHSIVVGDAASDVEAAHAIGAQAILVLTGRGEKQHAEMTRNNPFVYHVVDDLSAAVDFIARQENLAV